MQSHVEGFETHQPGFSLQIKMPAQTLVTDPQREKIFGTLSSLMSVAIFEERNEAIQILEPEG